MWIILSLLTAILEALKDGLCKKGVMYSNVLTLAWAWKFFSLPFLCPLLLISGLPCQLTAAFWWALAIGGGLNIIAALLYVQALKYGELSLTLPMLSFTPIFLLATSPLMVGDIPNIWGIAGVLIIFLGSFILSINEHRPEVRSQTSLAQYLRLGLKLHKGPRLMLLVALIWSFAANMDKIGLRQSNPFFWAVAIQAFISLGLGVIIVHRHFKGIRKSEFSQGPVFSCSSLILFLLIGLCTAAGITCQMLAIASGLVPYVISIKRLNIIFGILIGSLFFREKKLCSRLAAGLLMICGVFLITLSSQF